MRFLLGAFVFMATVSACENPDHADQTVALLQAIPPPTAVIGNEDTFGAIASAALLPGDRLVVADGMTMHLILFSGGTLVDRVGGRGQGPGEFRGIGSVAAFGEDSVAVLESPTGRIILYRADQHSLERLRAIPLPFTVGDLCSLGDRLFVLGEWEGHLVHEVRIDGSMVRSFAPREEGSHPMETALSSSGSLACSEQMEAVAFGQLTLGGVRVFSLDGEPLLNDSIPRFSRTIYDVDARGFRPRIPDIGHAHSVTSLHWLDDGLLIHLLRGSGPADLAPEARWWSQTGGWADQVADWPRVLTSSPEGDLYLAVEEPYPMIHVVRLR